MGCAEAFFPDDRYMDITETQENGIVLDEMLRKVTQKEARCFASFRRTICSGGHGRFHNRCLSQLLIFASQRQRQDYLEESMPVYIG